MDVDQVKLRLRREAGRELTALVWRFPRPVRALASGPLGGGVGLRRWVLLAQVPSAVQRAEPATYLSRLAVSLGLAGVGVGLATTGDLRSALRRVEDGVVVVAAPGSAPGEPRLSADERHTQAARPARSIDLLIGLPLPVADAELVRTATVVTSVAAGVLGHSGLGCPPGPLQGLCVVCPDGPEAVGASDWAFAAGRALRAAFPANDRAGVGPVTGPCVERPDIDAGPRSDPRPDRLDRKPEALPAPFGRARPVGPFGEEPAGRLAASLTPPSEPGGSPAC